MNAYIFALLLLWGEIVVSQIPLPGSCPDIPPFKNLNLEKYPGNWYEVEKYFFALEASGTCISVNYTANHDGTLNTQIRFTESVSGNKIAFPGKTIFLDPDTAGSGKTGNMQLTLSIINPYYLQTEVQKTYIYKLIDTDYVNYAIKWSCLPLMGVHF
ncbi:Lopap, partial [Folsomia candida]